MNIRPIHSLPLNLTRRSTPFGVEALERRENPSGLTATFHLDSHWGTGMQGTVTVENQTAAPVSNWVVSMEYANSIASVWDGRILFQTNTGYKITHNGWNSSIAPGQKVSFGFVGGANHEPGPKNLTVSAEGIAPAPAPTPTPAPTPIGQVQVKVEYKVTSDWGSGFNGDISITNVGDLAITGWTLGFHSTNTITSVWNATKVNSGDNYLFSDAGWNQVIAKGATVSFGFTATGNGKAIPPGFTFNGQSVGSTPTPTTPPTPATPQPTKTPSLSIANVSLIEGNSGTKNMDFKVQLSSPTTSDVQFTVNTVNGTAIGGVDFQPLVAQVVTIAAGKREATVSVPIIGDSLVESNETFSLLLSAATGVVLGNISPLGTIENDDVSPPESPPPGNNGTTGKRVVTYFTEWAVYDRKFTVADLPVDKLTTINYAFAKITEAGEVGIFDSWAAVEKPFGADKWDTPLKGNYHQLQLLKQSHPNLEILISVGGWTLSDRFSDVALTAQSRAKFAASAVDFCNKYGFDGVDLDWEYPVGGGLETNKYRPEDKHNYTLLVEEIRRQFNLADAVDGDHRLITIAAPAGFDKMVHFELATMSQSLDWMNLMTYDYHGSWENGTNHQAALFANPKDPSPLRDQYNISHTVDAYLGAGVPAEKLILGAPIYGRSWKGVPSVNNGLFQESAGAGKGTWEIGVVDYSDLLNKTKSQPDVYQLLWDEMAQVPYVYAPTVEGGWFSTFETTQSLEKKIDYLMGKEMGGIMFWESSGDVRDANSPDSLTGTAARLLLGK